MTYKNVKWHESEVMRSLERQARKSGHFNLTDEEKIEEAVFKLSNELKHTDDLYTDIVVLSGKLREKGYEKQASELEEKAVLFKQAEVHLYRVHDEDGEDLLEYAHPEGDVQVAPAQGDLGKVYTQQGQHKAILEVVKKNPKSALYEIAESVKTAQDATSEIEEVRDRNQGKADEILAGLRMYIDKYIVSALRGGELAKQASDLVKKLYQQLTLDRTGYDEANAKIKSVANELKELFAKIESPDETDIPAVINYTSLRGIIGQFGILASNAITNITKLIPGLVGEELESKDRALNVDKINKSIEFVDYGIKLLSELMIEAQGVGADETAKGVATNIETGRKMVRAFTIARDRKYSLLQLIRGLAPTIVIQSEDDLVEFTRKWAYEIDRQVRGAKTASQKNELVKIAQGITVTPIAPLSGKKLPPPPVGLYEGAKKPEAPSPGLGAKAPSTKAADDVLEMQKFLSDISKNMIASKDSVAKNLGIDVNQLETYANVIGSGGVDGFWGERTKNALKSLNELISAAQKNTGFKGNPLDFDRDYKRDSVEVVSRAAKENINSIKAFMDSFKEVAESAPVVVDKIPTVLTRETMRDVSQGEAPLTLNDLSSVDSFVNYLAGFGIKPNLTAAIEISLVKVAQNVGYSVKDFDNAVRWVAWRAWNKLEGSQTAEEKSVATQYFQAARNLSNQWQSQKKKRQYKESDDLIVSRQESGLGAEKPKEEKRNLEGTEFSFDADMLSRVKNAAPFTDSNGRQRDFIDLSYLVQTWGGDRNVYKFLADSTISYDDWYGAEPRRLWLNYATDMVRDAVAKSEDKVARAANWFAKVTEKFSRDLNNAYRKWLREALVLYHQLSEGDERERNSARALEKIIKRNKEIQSDWQAIFAERMRRIEDWKARG